MGAASQQSSQGELASGGAGLAEGAGRPRSARCGPDRPGLFRCSEVLLASSPCPCCPSAWMSGSLPGCPVLVRQDSVPVPGEPSHRPTCGPGPHRGTCHPVSSWHSQHVHSSALGWWFWAVWPRIGPRGRATPFLHTRACRGARRSQLETPTRHVQLGDAAHGPGPSGCAASAAWGTVTGWTWRTRRPATFSLCLGTLRAPGVMGRESEEPAPGNNSQADRRAPGPAAPPPQGGATRWHWPGQEGICQGGGR